jgi:hypothetical protein
VPIAGYCHECAEWVWVAEDRSCPKGHAAAHVNGCYESETGEPTSPQRASVRPVPPERGYADPAPAVDASGTRVGFLSDLSAAFAQSPSYSAAWGTDTDMTVASNPVDVMWGTGKDRTVYTAALKVSEVDRTVCFWEQLSGQASGFGTVDPETSGEWGYGTTKAVVKEVAARHGFTVRVVLSRRAAIW